MAVYEYICARCGEHIEFIMSVAEYDEFDAICTRCGSMDLRRKWSGIASHVDHAE